MITLFVISIISTIFWLALYYVLILTGITAMSAFWVMFIAAFVVYIIGKSAYESFKQK